MPTPPCHPRLARLPAPLVPGLPPTALAPMQDVTDLAFMSLVGAYGPPDWFFTEYFRVTETSRLEPHILRSITDNPTGRPVFAQLIGENLVQLARTARELQAYPIAGVDLNMGCPAPKIYRKNVGGGLLRDLPRADRILGTLREAVPGLFTVKMRIGFDDASAFEELLDLIDKHRVDLLSLHGRTVKGLYRSEVRYDLIARAAERVACPVLANGEITSAAKAGRVLAGTRAAGVMVGRSAIRNPWIFGQIRARCSAQPVVPVSLGEVRGYIDRLWAATDSPGVPERARVGRMKKYLNFVGQGVDAAGAFLGEMRRTSMAAELFAVCDRHLLARAEEAFADEPFPGLVARPTRESPAEECCVGDD